MQLWCAVSLWPPLRDAGYDELSFDIAVIVLLQRNGVIATTHGKSMCAVVQFECDGENSIIIVGET
ncbi:hypothetical protein D3C80_1561060 [compost metagenome]